MKGLKVLLVIGVLGAGMILPSCGSRCHCPHVSKINTPGSAKTRT